jgi:hypothetical protein
VQRRVWSFYFRAVRLLITRDSVKTSCSEALPCAQTHFAPTVKNLSKMRLNNKGCDRDSAMVANLNLLLEKRHAKTKALHSLAQFTRAISSFYILLRALCYWKTTDVLENDSIACGNGSMSWVASGTRMLGNARCDVPGFVHSQSCGGSAAAAYEYHSFKKKRKRGTTLYSTTFREWQLQPFVCLPSVLCLAAKRRCVRENWFGLSNETYKGTTNHKTAT